MSDYIDRLAAKVGKSREETVAALKLVDVEVRTSNGRVDMVMNWAINWISLSIYPLRKKTVNCGNCGIFAAAGPMKKYSSEKQALFWGAFGLHYLLSKKLFFILPA